MGSAQFGGRRIERGLRQREVARETTIVHLDGMARPDARGGWLERKPQGKLDEAWKIVLTSDPAKVRSTTTTGIGGIELRMVESVEELRAELDPHPFVATEPGVFEDREVKVPHAVVADVRFGAGIAQGTGGREVGRVAFREYGSVEPVRQSVVQRTGRQMRQSSSRRAGTGHVWDAGVTQRAGATADDDREAGLECNDGIDSPSADELVGHSV